MELSLDKRGQEFNQIGSMLTSYAGIRMYSEAAKTEAHTSVMFGLINYIPYITNSSSSDIKEQLPPIVVTSK